MSKIDLFKFPRTKHLFDAGGTGVSRDDLIFSPKEATSFLNQQTLIIEEKVDGANLGISIDKNSKIQVQNRSHYVFNNTHRQFNTIDSWLEKHSEWLFKILEPERHVLYGEWLYVKHSIHYTKLQSYFIAFDIFDKVDCQFYSVDQRNEALKDSGIPCASLIKEGIFTKQKLLELLETQSEFYNGPVEGIVIRKPGEEIIKDGYFNNRAKIVRPDFLNQIDEQWTRQKFTKNKLLHY